MNMKSITLLFLWLSFNIWSCGSTGGNTQTSAVGYGYSGPPAPQYATIYYIRTDATGDNSGLDWNNAFTSIPGTLQRGEVYYLADGSYGTCNLTGLEDGTQYIGIKKAIESDHGTDVGWDGSYGDGVADFERIDINNSYFEIDGQTGGGPNSWTTGHGIQITGPWSAATENGRLIFLKQYISNIIISHIEFNSLVTHQGHGHCFYGLDVSNIKMDHCYAHDVYGCFILTRDANNFLVEYNYFYNNLSNAANHGEFLSEVGSDNLTFRYNFFNKIDGTATFAGVNGDPDNPSERWEIYGNIITDSTHFIYYYYQATDYNEARNWRIYNNTIVNKFLDNDINGRTSFGLASGIHIINNLWYNFQDDYSTILNYIVIHKDGTDYNSFYDCDFRNGLPPAVNNEISLSGNPFFDVLNDQLDLIAPTTPGQDLKAPYNQDMFGNIRGSDDVWDRGAVEYE